MISKGQQNCFVHLIIVSSYPLFICWILRSWCHEFLDQSPHDWRTMMHWNVVPTIFHKPWDIWSLWKIPEQYLNVSLSSNYGERALNSITFCPVWDKFQCSLRASPRDWRTLVHVNIVQAIFHNEQEDQGLCKIVLMTFQCIVVLQSQVGGGLTMRGTPGREPHVPYQNQTYLTKYGIVCPFKRNILTAEGQHFICPLNVWYILY